LPGTSAFAGKAGCGELSLYVVAGTVVSHVEHVVHVGVQAVVQTGRSVTWGVTHVLHEE
jgi:hypothetical protein